MFSFQLSLPRLKNLLKNTGLFQAFIATAAIACITTAFASTPQPQNADLAIIFPAQKDIRIAAGDVSAPGRDAFLPASLVKLVENSFKETSVGDALSMENEFTDWTLVSARVVPCSPLGVVPGSEANVLCWPEVRLVWQPILKDFRRYAAILPWFADDRAIHALYDVHPSIALAGEPAIRAQQVLEKVKAALERKPTAAISLITSDELNEFRAARDAVSDALMKKALALRSEKIAAKEYSKVGERPEFNTQEESVKFIARMRNFIAQTTSFAALKEMTSFSLPEGREPPQSDEWVFLKYLKQNGKMTQVDITVASAIDGRELINMGKSPKASQMRDDPELHTALEGMNSRDAEELKKHVLLSPQELSAKNEVINDRALSHVANTTCGSCHKFNSLRFDFHNLSYLEDRTVSVSPRVKFDLLRDMEWLEQRKQR